MNAAFYVYSCVYTDLMLTASTGALAAILLTQFIVLRDLRFKLANS